MRAQIGEAADRRHSAPIASAVLRSVLCAAVVAAAGTLTREYAMRAGSYRTGIITLAAFALASAYSARKRSLWFSVRWLRAAMRLPGRLAVRLVVLDRLEVWRAVHITIGVLALLPFWWHVQASGAKQSKLELALESAVIMLMASGFTGAAIQDFLPPLTRTRPEHEVRLVDVDSAQQALYVEAEQTVLGHSENLTNAYLHHVRPILNANHSTLRFFWATLSGADPAPAICHEARAAAAAAGADAAIYNDLVDIAERKIRLEHNRFNLRAGTAWLSFHIGLAIATAVLVAFHVGGVLYFGGL